MIIENIYIPPKEEEIINHPDTFPDIDLEHPMEYNGWYIWKWTGWKGSWSRRNPKSDICPKCYACGKSIDIDDIVYTTCNTRDEGHAKCFPHYNGEIYAQWLAMDKPYMNDLKDLAPERRSEYLKSIRYMYSSTPGGCGIYLKGECFDIKSSESFTYFTDPEILKKAQADALERLKACIDGEAKNANL